MQYDQRMQRISRSLSSQYQVTVLSRKKYLKDYTSEKYNIISFKPWLKKGLGFYAIMNTWFFIKLCFMKYDAICAVDLDSLWPAYSISRLRKKKLIFDAHELYEETPELLNRPKVKRFWTKLAYKLIPNSEHNYTVNEVLAKEMSQLYKAPFTSIRNVPLLDNETIQSNTRERYIIYQGVLNLGRGLENIITAMQHIDFAKLYLVGEGDVTSELKALTKQLQVEEKVKFLGQKLPAELREITKQAWVGINLLEANSKSYFMSLANKYFDYIHAEIPQISMNFPVYQDLNSEYECAVLVDDLNVKTLVETINTLKNNDHLYKELKQNCSEAKYIYNWQEEEKSLLSFYERVFVKA